MTGWRTASIRTKVIAYVLVGAIVPLVGLAVLAVHDVRRIRAEIVAESSRVAAVVAEYSAADLAFDDREEGAKSLQGLATLGTVRAAVLCDAAGRLFAAYHGPGLPAVPSCPEWIALWETARADVREDRVEVHHPVVHDGTRYGTLVLWTSTARLEARLEAHLWGMALVMLAVVAGCLLIAALLRRTITQPILGLTAAARRLAETEDYSVRVETTGGDEIGVLGQAFNRMLAETARRQQEAEDAIRGRDDFLLSAAHELKTPLTSLKLQVQFLEGIPPKDTEKRRRSVEMIARQAWRLEQLVGNLLDVSRITAGRLELERTDVDLAAVVREVAASFEQDLARSGSTLTVSAESITGSWDPLRLTQVITNLLANAIKYGAGKPIEVTTEAAGSSARLVVRDRGIGVAREDLERIFGRFERAVSLFHYAGMGFGLYITRQIVEAHGGTIRVESELGAGSTFIVELPRGIQPHDGPRDRASQRPCL